MIDCRMQAQLRAKYNPEGSQLRLHQLRLLEMLKYFDELCKKNDIRYWLSSGNCLGLVRHGGFIPWDDDIDVEMLREDYLKLEKVFEETDRYALQTWKNDKYYLNPFAKMRDKHSYMEEHGHDELYKYRGVFIDVFQIEKAPRYFCKAYEIIRWVYLNPLRISNNKWKKRLFIILKFVYFGSISLCRLLFGWYPNNKYRHSYGEGWIDKIRDVNEIFPLHRASFDGVEVYVPNNISVYLEKIYGDFMKLPPEDKIQKPHVSKIEMW